MTDLNQVVDLCAAADTRFTNRRAIDGGVGAELHVVFEHDDSGLHDLVVRAVVLFGIAVAIRADLHSILENHVVADLAEFAYRHMGIGLEVVADARAA